MIMFRNILIILILLVCTPTFARELEVECNWDNQTRRKTTPPPFKTNSYDCTHTTLNPWQIKYEVDRANNKYRWRAYFEWDNIELPTNAVATAIEIDFWSVNRSGGSVSIDTKQCTTTPKDITVCANLHSHIDGKEVYSSDSSWLINDWKTITLSSTAVDDLNSHPTWFAVGLRITNEIDGDYVFIGNQSKFFPAVLRITYKMHTVLKGIVIKNAVIY